MNRAAKEGSEESNPSAPSKCAHNAGALCRPYLYSIWLRGGWDIAIFLIAGAALLDTLDGRIARLVGGSSNFGGQLDSLVDSIAFGVAPVIVMFLWSLQSAAGIGWAIAFLFPFICCVLRLARFNVSSTENALPTWSRGFSPGYRRPQAPASFCYRS